MIPKGLELDLLEGEAWVSVVAFRMEKIRPRGLPSLSLVSDFLEINVRTYVSRGNKSGVYFLNIEAQKALSAFISRNLSGLPYEKSDMSSKYGGDYVHLRSLNKLKGFRLEAEFRIEKMLKSKKLLDLWLTERYCLYLEEKNKLFRYEIHHEEWEISKPSLDRLDINYQIGELSITSQQEPLIHYSKGVRVLAWHREEC